MSQNRYPNGQNWLRIKVVENLTDFPPFFCDLRRKPMPIEFIKGLKANQAPNYRDANMVVSPGQSHQPLTKVKTHAGYRNSQSALRRSIPKSSGQEIGTQSRPCFGLGRYAQAQKNSYLCKKNIKS